MKAHEFVEYQCIEGEQGVEVLNEIAQALGYEKHPWRFGTPLEVFLADNSGAVEAIMNWIDTQPDFNKMLEYEDEEPINED